MDIIFKLLIAGILGVIGGLITIKVRSKSFNKRISFCPTCKKRVNVSSDLEKSRLVLGCTNNLCNEITFFKVRPSLLSLFGLIRFILIVFCGVFFYFLPQWLELNQLSRISMTFIGFLSGWIGVTLIVKKFSHYLLRYIQSPILQSEIVSHLTQPSFLKKR